MAKKNNKLKNRKRKERNVEKTIKKNKLIANGQNHKGQFVKKYNDGYGSRNTTLTIAISEDLKQELKSYAFKNNDKVSNVVNKLIINHLTGGH